MCYNKSSNNLKFKNEPQYSDQQFSTFIATILKKLYSICLPLHLTPANQGTLKFRMG